MTKLAVATDLILLTAAVVASLVAVTRCAASPLPLRVAPDASHQERLEAARALLKESPLIDGHNDLAWNLRKFLHNKLHSFNLSYDLTQEKPWRKSPFSHTDLPRLREGHVAAQFWSVYVPCETQYLNTVQLLMEQIDVIKRMVAASSGETTLVTSPAGIEREFKRGYVASLMGVEGGHSIASSMGVVRALHDLGVRYITLTHKCHTPWAECSETEGNAPNARGLTPYGKEMIREMNRVGMMIDVSHASTRTVNDVLRTSRSPVIFSHSAARHICDLERNVPDDVLRSLAINGGILMVSFFNGFLTCNDTATLQDVVAHINYVRSVAGVDHVGLGAGYDGINRTPKGLEDVSKYPELFAELLRDPTWSILDLKKLAGLNMLRVFRTVEEVSEDMADEIPSEEIIPIHDIDTQWPCRYKFASLDFDRAKRSSSSSSSSSSKQLKEEAPSSDEDYGD
ncbi:dipeptidase 1-like [Penaeus vannamei]|uniref:dipeptidase 1-like n=1 Tax=Penaeus vannamei TaxID=6689 RepID=UPI00387F7155